MIRSILFLFLCALPVSAQTIKEQTQRNLMAMTNISATQLVNGDRYRVAMFGNRQVFNRQISYPQQGIKPGDEWSIKEVLDHLIYATALITERIRDLAARRAPRPFTTDNSAGQSMRPIQDLRREMARLLEGTVVVVGSLPEGNLPSGTWEHPDVGPLNLNETMALHRLHIMDHVQQIEKIKADPGYPTS